MVEQGTALPESRIARRPEPARSAVPSAEGSEPALTAPWLLLAILVCLLIPGNFSLAGAQMSPYRALLLLLVPFLGWRWLRGDAGGPNVRSERRRRPGDVQPLAPGGLDERERSVDLPPDDAFHLEELVDRRVGGDADDHRQTIARPVPPANLGASVSGPWPR